MITHFGLSRGSGSLRPRPAGCFSASSADHKCNSASTLPYKIENNSTAKSNSINLC